MDAKIRALDNELRGFKDQISKNKSPAAVNLLKKRAVDTLKRKKMYEQQRDQLASQAFNIDQTVFAIETVKSTQLTVSAMKEASTQLKMENSKLNISEIEDMQDDMEGNVFDIFFFFSH